MPHPKKIALACALALAATTVLAQGHVIKDIRLEGISRTEAGTVFSHLPIRVGDTYSPELGAESLRSLYASGMFQDVQLDMDGNVLVVRVQERPTVANIHTTGISEFDAKGVEKSLRDVGLAEGFIFDRAVLDRAVQELRRQYLSRGRYSADVKVTVTPVERNRVRINIALMKVLLQRFSKSVLSATKFMTKAIFATKCSSVPRTGSLGIPNATSTLERSSLPT